MENNDKINIIWSSGEREVALKLVFMYAYNAKLKEFWKEVNIIVWGPSQKLLAEDDEIKSKFENVLKAGVTAEACIACSEMLGVTRNLVEMDIDVKPMGVPLTDIIKSGGKLITF